MKIEREKVVVFFLFTFLQILGKSYSLWDPDTECLHVEGYFGVLQCFLIAFL